MEVTLPSGATVLLRDKLTAADKFAVQDQVSFSLDTTTGLQRTPMGFLNKMRNELLKLIIEKWSLDQPLPKDDLRPAQEVFGAMDIDDYNALSEAVEPMLNKLTGGNPNRGAQSSS